MTNTSSQDINVTNRISLDRITIFKTVIPYVTEKMTQNAADAAKAAGPKLTEKQKKKLEKQMILEMQERKVATRNLPYLSATSPNPDHQTKEEDCQRDRAHLQVPAGAREDQLQLDHTEEAVGGKEVGDAEQKGANRGAERAPYYATEPNEAKGQTSLVLALGHPN